MFVWIPTVYSIRLVRAGPEKSALKVPQLLPQKFE